eukprot:Clim_evm58s153 gene=Clim_evmTU58s153
MTSRSMSQPGLQSQSSFWCNKEPAGLFVSTLLWAYVLYAYYTTVFVVILPSQTLTASSAAHILFLSVVVVLILGAQLRAMLTDPGAVPVNDVSPAYADLYAESVENGHAGVPTNHQICNKCGAAKDEDTHHCSLCNRCIRKMDHHCPWINNCVGEQNLKYFCQLLFWGAIGTLYVVYWCISFWIHLTPRNRRHMSQNDFAAYLLTGSLGALLCCFCLILLGVQFSNISDEKTTIHKLKEHQARIPVIGAPVPEVNLSNMDSWYESFNTALGPGGPMSWFFFCAGHPTAPTNYMQLSQMPPTGLV